MISEEAVEAVARAICISSGEWDEQAWDTIMPERHKGKYREQATVALEAASPFFLVGSSEWGIFRAHDPADATPIENLRYKTSEAAQRFLERGYSQTPNWEVRGRVVGEWKK
jgi:hypothetical protein